MQIIAKTFATILAVLVASRLYLDLKAKREGLTMTVFWVGIWIAILIVAYFPSLIDKLISLLGGQRTGLGTVFGMALAFLLFINYRIYAKAHRVEKALEQLSRKIALKDLTGVKGKVKRVKK